MALDIKFFEWISKTWKIRPENINLYQKAITLPEYETLEFLGDSLLDFIVADYLVKAFPGKPPGWLTKKRMTLVNENALGDLGLKIGIHNFAIFPSTSSKKQITPRVLGDMVEALIAAIYIDQGLEIAKNSLHGIMELEKITEELSLNFLDPIGIVQEFLAHKSIPPPAYRILKVSGTEHEPIFEMEAACTIGSHIFRARGYGKSKKDAAKEAAQKLLQKLENSDSQDISEEHIVKEEESYLQELHIFLAKKGMRLPSYKDVTLKKNSPSSIFVVEASCGCEGNFFIERGEGSSKKKAKQAAAQKILAKVLGKK